MLGKVLNSRKIKCPSVSSINLLKYVRYNDVLPILYLIALQLSKYKIISTSGQHKLVIYIQINTSSTALQNFMTVSKKALAQCSVTHTPMRELKPGSTKNQRLLAASSGVFHAYC